MNISVVTQTSTRVWTAFLVLILSCTWAAQAHGSPGDRDGTRLKAKSFKVGRTVSDSLEAPKDRSDWRYITVKSDGQLTVALTYKPASAPLTLRLLDAQGRELQSRRGSKGKASLKQQLKPGIYYLEVELSSGSTHYTVSCAFK
ncbi:MAG: T9SS type A sorting domain-containing protein [Myxococcota bacterium]